MALDFSRDTTDGSLQANGTYNKITGSFSTNTTSDVTPLSDPYTYKNGGTPVSNNYFTYITGSVDNTPFLGWADSDNNNIMNNNHYYMQIFGLTGSEVYDNVLHITLACGNDVGRGETVAPVPEPGTMMLFGIGMLGLAVYGKRRMNKDA
ncbi:MAG: PEP-CTERM sorting domain-containing protein [Deltaproteobacteria bacterium]|nr:PEP-CTERM sorting domain-containing protein [Deltaproteobacteria bacterium]